jgi:hypothetical protein
MIASQTESLNDIQFSCFSILELRHLPSRGFLGKSNREEDARSQKLKFQRDRNAEFLNSP